MNDLKIYKTNNDEVIAQSLTEWETRIEAKEEESKGQIPVVLFPLKTQFSVS